ncbi:SGNH/GDSL hydrolase family protein [Lyngbya confervoides]|uniref:SGNH/GDSL hydrolase family protein n=1 Tax=Lyngbya confervoides BDU141951 TaxID=1574623 RepID=A0ABD4T862_9CYAN|nr:SGNH/GDSL hydrolase family protein [Lyngbya confervoides]MCM1984492.1 SGNH/GDSL hydrolase family protein [Lyngbya confervoides BDU141951]
MDAQPTSSFSDIGDLFSNLYVFGDSLTDIGNIKNVTEFVQPFDWLFGLDIPVAPPPTPEGVPPYFEGRFSNGPVWIDIVADSLGKSLTASSKLSVFRPGLLRFPSPITVTQEGLSVSPYFNGNLVDANVNFAFGGANTDQTGLGGGDFDTLIPGALKQVGWLEKDLARSRESIAPEALVIYWFGPNDYWTNPQADPETTVGNIEEGLTRLIDMGAQNLLVPNMPNLSKVPRFNEAEGNPKPPYDSQVINDFSLHHNALLQETLDGLIGEYPDVNFIQLDVNALFEEALDPLSDFGFTNTVHPFLSPLTPMNADPKDYLFWDDIHPTAGAHDILAHTALTELQEFFLPAEGSLFQTQFDQRTPSLV